MENLVKIVIAVVVIIVIFLIVLKAGSEMRAT